MSRARHHAKKRAAGGLSSKPEWEAGGESNAAKESEEKKHGGKVHGEGHKPKHGAHRRARGGKVHHEEHEHEKRRHGGHVGHHEEEHEKRASGGGVHGHEPHHAVKGHSMHHRHGMHVPGRKRGGGVGADKTPLTTAANVKHVIKGEEPEKGVPSD